MSTLLLIAALASAGRAAPEPPRPLWVYAPGPAERRALVHPELGFAEGDDAGWWRFDAGPGGLAHLDAQGIRWRPADLPHAAPDGYPSPEQTASELAEIAASHPDDAQFVDLGITVEGRSIAALRLGAPEPAVTWRVFGAHHGDERSSSALAVETIYALLGTEAGARILQRDAVWVAPMVNADGVAAHTRHSANLVDLNRNYGYEWSTNEYMSGAAPFSEPETRAMRSMADLASFGAGLSMHGGATNLGWVWNYTTSRSPDQDLLESIAQGYADECDLAGFWITNGADWYATRGDTTDWAYGRHGTLDYTLEVSSQKTPALDQLDDILDAHIPAVMGFLAWQDVAWGQVFDESSGHPIPATLRPIDHDAWPVVAGPDGRFGRPLAPGVTAWEASSPGYAPTVFELSSPAEHAVDVRLVRESLLEAAPSPRLLSATSDGVFTAPADVLQLSRPGFAPVIPARLGDAWQIDPRVLAPGPWTVETTSGAAPRSLFVGEIDDQVAALGADWDGQQIILTGEGFGAGARAFALFGAAREPSPLPLVSMSDTTLVFDSSRLPQLDVPVDLWVITRGRQLTVLDVLGDPQVDTGTPSSDGTDTGEAGRYPSDELTACGCSAGPRYPTTLLCITLAALCLRRRDP